MYVPPGGDGDERGLTEEVREVDAEVEQHLGGT
jgi:hypothetical protein